jgi:hypothetical protein
LLVGAGAGPSRSGPLWRYLRGGLLLDRADALPLP